MVGKPADERALCGRGAFKETWDQLSELFSTSRPNVGMRISNILEERGLGNSSVVKDFLTTAADGKNYTVRFSMLYL